MKVEERWILPKLTIREEDLAKNVPIEGIGDATHAKEQIKVKCQELYKDMLVGEDPSSIDRGEPIINVNKEEEGMTKTTQARVDNMPADCRLCL